MSEATDAIREGLLEHSDVNYPRCGECGMALPLHREGCHGQAAFAALDQITRLEAEYDEMCRRLAELLPKLEAIEAKLKEAQAMSSRYHEETLEFKSAHSHAVSELVEARNERAFLLQELTAFFGPAPSKFGASENERWVSHIASSLQAAALRDERMRSATKQIISLCEGIWEEGRDE